LAAAIPLAAFRYQTPKCGGAGVQSSGRQCALAATAHALVAVTRQVLGEGLARRALAGEGRHRHLGGDLVLGGRALQLLELQLGLIQKPRRTLQARAIELARQLRDPQPLVGDQGLIIGALALATASSASA
jgi:hypothetical protein